MIIKDSAYIVLKKDSSRACFFTIDGDLIHTEVVGIGGKNPGELKDMLDPAAKGKARPAKIATGPHIKDISGPPEWIYFEDKHGNEIGRSYHGRITTLNDVLAQKRYEIDWEWIETNRDKITFELWPEQKSSSCLIL